MTESVCVCVCVCVCDGSYIEEKKTEALEECVSQLGELKTEVDTKAREKRSLEEKIKLLQKQKANAKVFLLLLCVHMHVCVCVCVCVCCAHVCVWPIHTYIHTQIRTWNMLLTGPRARIGRQH